MKYQFLVFALLLAIGSPARAIEISESTLNAFVTRRLAEKPPRDVEVLAPKVSLREGYATLCATVRARLLPSDVDLCANMTPVWRRETGSLLATHMAITSLTAPGLREKDVELMRSVLNQTLLPRLEGMELYRADDFIGKQISTVKVMPGKIDISL